MKTVLDAVIATRASLDKGTISVFIRKEDKRVFCAGTINKLSGGYSGTYADSGHEWHVFNEYWDKVGSGEFNALVGELASNFGKCDISYQKHCSNEVTRLEGDGMKTVTHEGKVYQIGAVYEFTDSDKGRHWELGILNDYANDKGVGAGFQSKTGNKTEWFKHIRLQQAPIGTITEAPIELKEKSLYLFTVRGKADMVGEAYFTAIDERPMLTNIRTNTSYSQDCCTNIKPLTVEK